MCARSSLVVGPISSMRMRSDGSAAASLPRITPPAVPPREEHVSLGSIDPESESESWTFEHTTGDDDIVFVQELWRSHAKGRFEETGSKSRAVIRCAQTQDSETCARDWHTVFEPL